MISANEPSVTSFKQRLLPCTVFAAVVAIALHVLSPGVLPLYNGSERFHTWVLMVGVFVIWMRRREILWRVALPAVPTMGLILGVSFYEAASVSARALDGKLNVTDTFFRVALAASIFMLYTVLSAFLTFLLTLSPRAKELLATPRGFWLRAARALVAMSVIFPYTFTSFNAHRSKISNDTDPMRLFKMPFEHVAFKSDGIPINGWFVPAPAKAGAASAAPKDGPTIILCHGLNANMASFLGLAPFLHHAGYNVLLFDFRGHGDSGGHTVTFSCDETNDVVAAAQYLKSRGLTQLGLYGFSMGGATAIRAAPLIPEVRCIATDSAFIDFPPLVAAQFKPFGRVVEVVGVAVTDLWSRVEVGNSLGDISPRPAVAGIGPRPFLIIHGTRDSLIPVAQAKELYDVAKSPKELFLIPGADHCMGRLVDPKPYEKRVLAFFKRGFQQ